MVYLSTYASPLQTLHIAIEEGAVVGLWLENQKYFAATIVKSPQKLWSRAEEVDQVTFAVMQKTCAWLDAYFAGAKPALKDLPIKPKGSEFRQRVWQELLKIPYGEVTTYGAIAKTIAAERGLKTMSAQAVGGAVGHNPISIIIPCHRVMGGDGSLTGYAGGVDKKLWLLRHEGLEL